MVAMPADAPALAFHCGELGYPGSVALRDVHFSIRPGERVALLGGNGTGKTALLKTIVGLLPARDGTVQIAGQVVTGAPKRAVEAGAGLVFQNPDDQLFGTSVREDVLFGPRNQGNSDATSVARMERALADLGIAHLKDRHIEALSFGEKKRASLAGVLAMQPSLLLLDEPTAGLDPAGERGFIELIVRLTGAGRAALLFATHAVDLVPFFADRVILLADHRIIADGPTRDVFGRAALLEAARVRPPLVSELWLRVTSGGEAAGRAASEHRLPLTVEEAAECLMRR
jgi:cobalt/nickel transport system ATP-binding protein